jgi:hypothetical protein
MSRSQRVSAGPGVRPDRHGDVGDGRLDQDPSVVEDGDRQACICASQVEQPLALWRAGLVERRRDRAPLEHVVELVGLRRPSLAHDLDSREASVSPVRPEVEQLAHATEERLIRVGRRCNNEPVELAKNGCSDQVTARLGVMAPSLRPVDEQAPAGARRRRERVGKDLGSSCVGKATAGNDQGQFTAGGGELRELCQAFGTSGAPEDLVVAPKAALENGLHRRESSGISEHHEEHRHRRLGLASGWALRVVVHEATLPNSFGGTATSSAASRTDPRAAT